MWKFYSWLAVVMLLATGPPGAQAQLIDPSTLQIGPSVNGSTDPVPIGSSGQVTVTNVSGGAGDLNTPWYVILGIPNTTTTTAVITSINGKPVAPISGTFEASMTSSSKDAYTVLENTKGSGIFAPTDASNNFVNWSGADQSINNITATSFGLFEYKIPVTLTSKTPDTFQFANLPGGTFVIAYGISGNHDYDTPFTEAGLELGPLEHIVPAPPGFVLAMSGWGALGLLCLARRRKVIALT